MLDKSKLLRAVGVNAEGFRGSNLYEILENI